MKLGKLLTNAEMAQFTAWAFQYGEDSRIKPGAVLVLDSGTELAGADVEAFLAEEFPNRRTKWSIDGRFILP